MKPLSDCTLYTFIDLAYLHGREVTDIARELCEGGSDLIQLRAKEWPVERIEAAAQSILPILRDYNVGLVINDHLEIAIEVGADLCHLGQEDFFDSGYTHISELQNHPGGGRASPRAVRRQGARDINPSATLTASPKLQSSIPQIGLSTHAPDQARRALSAGAHYVAIGPIFPTGTKPGARPVTLEYVRWASANITIPWFAIGGINLTNLDSVLAAGATRVCVVSAILNSRDIAAECREFRMRMG